MLNESEFGNLFGIEKCRQESFVTGIKTPCKCYAMRLYKLEYEL